MMMLRFLKAPQHLATQARRSNSTIAGTVYYRCNYHDPALPALISPAEKLKLTYGELWANVLSVAGGLTKAGFQAGSVVATDLDHSAQAVFLQMAAAHNGMQVLTVKDKEQYDRLAPTLNVHGAVSKSGDSFLKGMTVADLQKSGGKPESESGATDRAAPHAYYGSDEVTSNRQIYLHGVGMGGLLAIKKGEQVCVAASLNHPFGMGAVLSAVVRSAVVYLPPVGSTDLGGSTVLIADKQGAASLKDVSKSTLRGGVVKVGEYDIANGIPMISRSSQVAGAPAFELEAEGKHHLYNACGDTYFPPSDL